MVTLKNILEKMKNNMSNGKVATCENFERKECKKTLETLIENYEPKRKN